MNQGLVVLAGYLILVVFVVTLAVLVFRADSRDDDE